VESLVTIAAVVLGAGVGFLHQVSHRVRTWTAGTIAYLTTVAVLAALALYGVVTSNGVPLVVCAGVVAALWVWNRPPASG